MKIINYEVLETAVKEVEAALEGYDVEEQALVIKTVFDRVQSKKQKALHNDLISASLTQENIQQARKAMENAQVEEEKE